MGRYIAWDDVIDRYPEINTLGGAEEISSSYIVFAEAFVDGLLSTNFTPPFSSNNITVKDLAIDCVMWRAGRFKLDSATEVRSAFFETIGMLRKGNLPMMDSDGNILPGVTANQGVYTSTQSYHSAFGMDDPLNWHPSSAQLSDLADVRD